MTGVTVSRGRYEAVAVHSANVGYRHVDAPSLVLVCCCAAAKGGYTLYLVPEDPKMLPSQF